jgi:NitT/TauT family transport system substrate-binding protein
MLWLVVLVGTFAPGCRRAQGPEDPLRLAYLPNVTHAQALVGTHEGLFDEALGEGSLETLKFNAGPQAMEALLAGEVDVAYVGGGPAITAFVRSHGELHVVAGAVSGGAGLVARGLPNLAALEHLRLAVPQLGNTQDIALRHWLLEQGMPPQSHGGPVKVTPVANPEILALFRSDRLHAAWVPEPWLSRLLVEAGARLWIDERTLWPRGAFPTTVVVVTDRALRERRTQVLALLGIHAELTRQWREDPAAFSRRASDAFGAHTGRGLSDPVREGAFSRMRPELDPMAEALQRLAEQAHGLGYVPTADVAGLVDPSVLRELPAAALR